jgi:hypothetical protein
MDILTVFDHPSDYPNHWVVRKSTIAGGILVPDPHAHLFSTLALARTHCADQGLAPVPRFASDDPVIVEVWM